MLILQNWKYIHLMLESIIFDILFLSFPAMKTFIWAKCGFTSIEQTKLSSTMHTKCIKDYTPGAGSWKEEYLYSRDNCALFQG